jgi:hypothetical protein
VARKITGEAGEAGEGEANKWQIGDGRAACEFRGKIDPDIVIFL